MSESLNESFELKNPFQLECLSSKPFNKKGLPTVIYFTLDAASSLKNPPFNRLLPFISHMQVLSITLPFHNEGTPHKDTIAFWRSELLSNQDFLKPFFQKVIRLIDLLQEEGNLEISRCAFAGLSRGVYIASAIASYFPSSPLLLGFSPMTGIYSSDEKKQLQSKKLYQKHWDMFHFMPQLYQKKIQFYIGNYDQKVSTESCCSFITQLASYAHQKRHKPCQARLEIFPSIGHKGHGTPDEILEKGGKWLSSQLK